VTKASGEVKALGGGVDVWAESADEDGAEVDGDDDDPSGIPGAV
jgi:hypothetical protein